MVPVLAVDGRLIVKNTAINLLGYVLPFFFVVFATPYVVNGFGSERYAVLSLSWVLLGYFTIFDLGIGSATAKFIAEAMGRGEYHEISRLLWSGVFLQALLGGLGGSILAALVPVFTTKVFSIPPSLLPEARHAFFVTAVYIPLTFVSGSFQGVFAAAQRFDLVNAAKLPAQLSIYIAGIAGVYFHLSIADVVGLILAARVVILVLLVVVCFHMFPVLAKPQISKATFRIVASYGGWLTVSNTINPLMFYVDRLLIGSMIGMSALTYYNVPFDLAARVWIISSSLTVTLIPAFSVLSSGNERDRTGPILIKAIKYLTLISGPVVCLIAAFSRDLLRIWIGPEFASAGTATLQLLLVGTILDYPATVCSSFLEGAGHPSALAKTKLVYFPVHVLLCVAFLKGFGLVGAAAAFLVMRVVYSLSFSFFALRVVGISFAGFLRRLLIPYVATSCFLGVSLLSGHLGLLTRVPLSCALLVLYMVLAWRYAVDRMDRAVLIGIPRSAVAAARRLLSLVLHRQLQ
jgi:O-antigen/teichoic acid export membrane protein